MIVGAALGIFCSVVMECVARELGAGMVAVVWDGTELEEPLLRGCPGAALAQGLFYCTETQKVYS